MCGIIGYTGTRPAMPLLLAGLERLEYRGYDSAGLCLAEDSRLEFVRAVGNLEQLKAAAAERSSDATAGVGHTRWATHGHVCVENTHPLTGCVEEELCVVLNGIVENYGDLREQLHAEGHVFTSETDAETVAHLVEKHYRGDLVEAVRGAYGELEGHFAFVITHRDHPDTLVGARLHCPLVVGLGEDGTFLASSIWAFLRETRRAQLIEDGEIVAVDPAGARFFSTAGDSLEREVVGIEWDDEAAEKMGYETYMLKEIFEQPAAVASTVAEYVRGGRLSMGDLPLSDEELRELDRVVVVACGTAYHAGVVARYVIEQWARVPCEFDIASEWRYREPVLNPRTLVIGITQSGETADTLAALRLARASGVRTVAVTNTPGSQVTREVDGVLWTRAGLEMGVAATKTFTAQVALLCLLALRLAEVRQTLPAEEIHQLVSELYALPEKIRQFLDADHPIDEIAERNYQKPFFFFLGRNVGLPIALEGAHKLKEIAYVPTEAYSAGEMKHGANALLHDDVPVVFMATDSHVYEKVVSNIQEVRARGAQVIAIASDGNEGIQHHADDVIYVPRTHPFLQALVGIVPLQLLAYRIARLRECNVDQPRNLAKTVTVE